MAARFPSQRDMASMTFLDQIDPDRREMILARGKRLDLAAGRILFHQGDRAEFCYLVVDGRLRLAQIHEQGREAILRHIGPGELTAVIAVFKQKVYPVTARAIGPTRVVGWDRATIDAILMDDASLAVRILHMAMERLHELQTRKTEAGFRIDFPLSRQDLADYSGTTLYTTSRILSGWEKSGWILSARERITITNPHALVSFARNGTAPMPAPLLT
jgi:CRP-like cAMP-binding protein